MLTLGLVAGFCLLTSASYGLEVRAASAPIVHPAAAPNVDEILDRMKAHDQWQRQYLIEYRAQRKFSAVNLRFKEGATLEVRTTFRRPDSLQSQVLRAEGSKLIRERVFDRILEAENETKSTPAKQQVDIVPANYSFSYLGQEDCAGRECYRLGIAPKRIERYLLKGQIWIDAKDWGIVRIQGSPAKRPSFWVRQTQIDRHYKRVAGMWLNDWLESTSDVFLAGRSSLKIQYSYESIQTDPQHETRTNSTSPISVLEAQPQRRSLTTRMIFFLAVVTTSPTQSTPGPESFAWQVGEQVKAYGRYQPGRKSWSTQSSTENLPILNLSSSASTRKKHWH